MEKGITKIKKEMEKAARDLDFMEAARLRDEMFRMQKELEGMKGWVVGILSCCDTGIFDIAILDNILTFPMGLGLQILSGRKIPF